MCLFCLISFRWEISLCNAHCPLLLKLLLHILPKLFLNQLTSQPAPSQLLIKSVCRLPQISSVVQPSLHWPILIALAFVFLLLQVLPKRTHHKVWRYSLTNFERACECLDDTDWDSLFASSNVNICWSNWKARFLEVMVECIPQSTLRSRRNLPWLTKSITQAIQWRSALFKVHKRSPSIPMCQKYQAARNRVTAMLCLSHWTK